MSADSGEQDQRTASNAMEDADPNDSLESVFTNQFVQDSFQSLTRVSLAGLGGSIVGMGLEKQQQQLQTNVQPLSSEISKSRHSRSHYLRSNPPAATGMYRPTIAHANLPATWALSCSFFVLILETARRTSPTSLILKHFQQKESAPLHRFSIYQQRALISTGDYALGGMVAGVAATVARKMPIRWGTGMGLTLGLAAGVVQAGVDVAEMYLRDQEDGSSHSQ
jgi:hypothetical protein